MRNFAAHYLTKEAGLGSLLFGMGEKAAPSVSKYLVTHPGVSYGAALPAHTSGLFLPSRTSHEVLKARLNLGGILGKGGLLRGEMAVDPMLVERLKRFKDNAQATSKLSPGRSFKNVAAIGGNSLMHGINVGATVGLPAYATYNLASAPGNLDTPDIGKLWGETAGYVAGGPLGGVGSYLAGQVGGKLGEGVGKLFYNPKPVAPVINEASNLAQPVTQNL